jgi:hypothetical protein
LISERPARARPLSGGAGLCPAGAVRRLP